MNTTVIHASAAKFLPKPRLIGSSDQYRLNAYVVASLLVAAAVVSPLDLVLAQFLMSDPLPGELRSLIHKTEFFGHGYGILGIAFTIYLLCDDRRRQLPRLLCSALLAGLAADVVKMLVHRVRPVDFSFAAGETSFKGISFLHAESIGQIFDSSFHSFPSAHTATAVAFAMALGAMFPQARSWFLGLATMCAISRFDGGAHYISDTLVGGAIGYAAACWTLGQTKLGKRFSDWEKQSVEETTTTYHEARFTSRRPQRVCRPSRLRNRLCEKQIDTAN